MRHDKFTLLLILSTILIMSACGDKEVKTPHPVTETSTIYLESIDGPSNDFLYFEAIDKVGSTGADGPFAASKIYKADIYAAINPRVVFFPADSEDVETLTLQTGIKSDPVPSGYLPLINAPEASEAWRDQNPNMLMIKRRLDLPFDIVETFSGKENIESIMQKLLNGSRREISVEINLQPKDKNYNIRKERVTIDLTLPALREESLPDNLRNYLKQ